MIAGSGGGQPEEPKARAGFDGLLDAYAEEVLRWNRQISLITRKEAAKSLRALIASCVDGAKALPEIIDDWDAEASAALGGARNRNQGSSPMALRYIDIGSGAGLPGIVWHAWLMAAEPGRRTECAKDPVTWLIEPRSKRAWFLERVARKLDLTGISVLTAKWGERGVGGDVSGSCSLESCLWLLSLRALKMSDQAVIEGWAQMTGQHRLPAGHRLAICRFRPPAGTSAAGAGRDGHGHSTPIAASPSSNGFLPRGTGLRAMGDKSTASLLVSFYEGC